MQNKKQQILATMAALTAQVIFGFSFLFTKIALNYATPFILLADRYLIAIIAMTLVMFITKTKLHLHKNIRSLLLMALFQPILYFLFETFGIRMTTSSFSSVMIAMIPVVSMLSGVFFLKEYPSPMQYVFTGLSVAGVALMAVLGATDGTVTPLGVLLLTGAVVSSVAYNILSRKISSEFTAFERTYMMMFVGFMVFMGIALAENFYNPVKILLPFTNVAFLAGAGYLGVISSVLAFFLMNYANTYLPVSKTTVFSNATTVVSVIAGVIFLKESFSAQAFFAISLIVIGVWGVQIQSVRIKKSNL